MMNDRDCEFVKMVGTIAALHSCRITNIDPEKHVLEIEGPPDKQDDCAQAIADLYQSFEIRDGLPGALGLNQEVD